MRLIAAQICFLIADILSPIVRLLQLPPRFVGWLHKKATLAGVNLRTARIPRRDQS